MSSSSKERDQYRKVKGFTQLIAAAVQAAYFLVCMNLTRNEVSD